MDIAGAQARFGWLGRLSRIDVRLAPGASRERCCASSRCPPACARPSPDEARSASERLARLPREPHGARARRAVHRRVPRVLDPRRCRSPSASSSSRCSACSAWRARRLLLVLAESALLGALGSVLGLALGTALARSRCAAAGDLGGGYFPGVAPRCSSIARPLRVRRARHRARVVGGWLPARSAQRLAPAQALKGLAAAAHAPRRWLGRRCCVAASCSRCCRRSPSAAGRVPVGRLPAARRHRCVPAGVALLLRGSRRRASRSRCWRSSVRATSATRDDRGGRRRREPEPRGRADGDGRELSRSVTQWLDRLLPADLYLRAARRARRRRRRAAAGARARARTCRRLRVEAQRSRASCSTRAGPRSR
jgi:putative ABC transport system permease protein